MAKDFSTALAECAAFLECRTKLTPVQLAEDVLALASVLPGANSAFGPPWCGATPPPKDVTVAAGGGLRKLEQAERAFGRALADAKGYLAAHGEGMTKPAWTADGGAPDWVSNLVGALAQVLIHWLLSGNAFAVAEAAPPAAPPAPPVEAPPPSPPKPGLTRGKRYP